jgi:phosphoribosylformylglycinamidine cyclo-ligase
LRPIESLLDSHAGVVKGMAHITGGGITDNLPRILPDGLHAVVDRRAWAVPGLFSWLQQTGRVPTEDMFRTFNMGIGLILVCAPADEAAALAALAAGGEVPRTIGDVRSGSSGVHYVG